MPALHELSTRDADGAFRVVVECPRGSLAKLRYEPALGAFTMGRPLPLGVAYPFDWGFVPRTSAPDGDPLDALVFSDAPTYPGVVVACRALAVLRVDQRAADGRGRQRNDRVIGEPVKALRASADGLTPRVRDELAAFFEASVRFAGKDIHILGWGDADEAEALVDRAAIR